MDRDIANVEPEMYDCTSNNWSHWIVTRSLRKNLETVPGKHSIDSLQKTAILGKYCSVKLEAWAVGITAGSREVPGRKGLWQETSIFNNNNNNNNNDIQEFVDRDKINVEPEMHDYTSKNWSHWNSNEKLKEKFVSSTRKTFDRFTTKGLEHHT